jgi:hypothetical protein
MAGTPIETILVQGRSYQLKESQFSLYYPNEHPLAGQTVCIATEQLNIVCEFKTDHANKLVWPTSPIVITYCNQSSSHNILELSAMDNDEPVFMTTGNGKDLFFVFDIHEENQTMRFKGIIKQKAMTVY